MGEIQGFIDLINAYNASVGIAATAQWIAWVGGLIAVVVEGMKRVGWLDTLPIPAVSLFLSALVAYAPFAGLPLTPETFMQSFTNWLSVTLLVWVAASGTYTTVKNGAEKLQQYRA